VNLAVALLDVSETGVRLVLREPLERGQDVEITLLGLGHLRPVKVLGSVVWCVATDNQQHCVGVQFNHRLKYADFQHLT
jgi:Tfp pilus assembly protein PilZ